MEFKIKQFEDLTTDELYKILKARIDVFVVEQNCPYEECDDKDYDSIHIFAQNKNSITAYLRIIPAGISYEEPSIGRVLVNKEYRRQGIAEKMMYLALEYIKNKLESDYIRISAQKYLLDFYQRLGFEKVSAEYLEDGIPHYEMLLKI